MVNNINLLSVVLAFDEGDITDIQTQSGLTGVTKLSAFISSTVSFSLTTLLFFIAGFAFLIYVTFAGFKLMTSAGDPKSIAEAKQMLTNAVVGVIITLTAFWIVQALGMILGLEGITATFG